MKKSTTFDEAGQQVAAMLAVVNRGQANTLKVLLDVAAERVRQDELVNANKIPFNCADPDILPDTKMLVLAEEVGEVAKAVYERRFYCEIYKFDPPPKPDALRTELIQLAAVACAWAESLTEPQTTTTDRH